jgi:hypothetical protein
MKKKSLSILCMASLGSLAQTISTGFESFSLPANSSYTSSGNKPFYDGGCVFPHQVSGGYWIGGFAYTNKRDSSVGDFTNLYGVRAYRGRNGSDKYVVGQQYATLIPAAQAARIDGFFVTNTTYAYKSMLLGDGFAKKFGGTSGNDPDYFKLVSKGYLNGSIKDSVTFYLADFRSSDNTKDYILSAWEYVDLSGLGRVDSVGFFLRSTDNHPTYGMNTPGFFAMDDLAISAPFNTGIVTHDEQNAGVFPNPCAERCYVNNPSGLMSQIAVYNLEGKKIAACTSSKELVEIATAELQDGIYVIEIRNPLGVTFQRLTKL